MPSNTAVINVYSTAVRICFFMLEPFVSATTLCSFTAKGELGTVIANLHLHQVNRSNDHVDCLDPDKGSDKAAQSVDPQVAPQQRGSRHGLILHTAQCQRNQRDNDERIEVDRRKNRRLR